MNRWLSVLIASALLGGCSCESKPSAVEKPIPKPVARTTDDFGLPLVIHIEAPEVPVGIRGPLPPVPASKKSAPKRPPKNTKKL